MLTLSALAVNAQADAVARLLSGGFLQLLSKDRVILAELRFGEPAFGKAEDGVIRSAPIASDLDARADGRATLFQCTTASGKFLLEGSVGDRLGAEAERPELVMNSVEIRRGSEIAVDEFVYVIPTGE